MVIRKKGLLRRSLTLLRAMLVAAIPLWLMICLFRSPSISRTNDLSALVSPSASGVSSPSSEHDLAWYSPLWTRNLKEPPLPKDVPQPAVTPEPPKNLPVLLATLVETQGRYAHFASPSGPPRLRGVDEVIDDYRVLEIEPGRVKLQRSNQLVWVEIPKSMNGR